MSGHAGMNTGCPQELRVLIFSVMGVRIALDADQISEMMDIETANTRGLTIRYFHEKISFGDKHVEYHAPKVIMIKSGNAPYGMVIDAPDDITPVHIRSIQPMPSLLARCGGTGGVWGAVIKNEQVVFLVDMQKLFSVRTPHVGAAEV